MYYYLSLGSNLGNREQVLRDAVQKIEQQIGHVPCCSSFYYSAPWGFQSEHEFCNICCRVDTEMTPLDVLRATQSIERALGRTHKTIDACYSDRIIDIDLIQAFDNEGQEIKCRMMNGQENVLTLPHPLWTQRDFVTVPLKEISSRNSR